MDYSAQLIQRILNGYFMYVYTLLGWLGFCQQELGMYFL